MKLISMHNPLPLAVRVVFAASGNRKGLFEVQPLEQVIEPGDQAQFSVWFRPDVPCKESTSLNVAVHAVSHPHVSHL